MAQTVSQDLEQLSDTVSINRTQSLFVIKEGPGYSCLGFYVVIARTARLISWLEETVHDVPTWLNERNIAVEYRKEVGSAESYLYYQELQKAVGVYCVDRRIKCTAELSPQLVGKEGHRVEVVTSYGEKRRFWVGKSTGWLPIHLEIARRDSSGGIGADREYGSVVTVSTKR